MAEEVLAGARKWHRFTNLRVSLLEERDTDDDRARSSGARAQHKTASGSESGGYDRDQKACLAERAAQGTTRSALQRGAAFGTKFRARLGRAPALTTHHPGK